MSLLEVNDLHVYYGVIQALKGISFHVEKGEIVALIGANGAGTRSSRSVSPRSPRDAACSRTSPSLRT